ncbi:MAG: DUF4331 family protein [Myxococcales bacterium]|nr:DUF4331 family protein [Myxococcales bacterium]
MKTHLALVLLASSALTLGFVGCSNDNSNNNGPPDSGGADQTSPGTDSGGGGNDSGVTQDTGARDTGTVFDTGTPNGGDAGPPPPALGTQIDRFGRPLVDTALNHVFDTNATTANAAKNAYNADTMIANWKNYAPEFAANLAVYDALDGICGNTTPATGLLSQVLTQDALWIDTSTTTCNQYLAVELKAVGAIAATDCGGRTLTENVLDITYNAVAGTLNPADGGPGGGPITNGITAPASPPTMTFPFLAAPH